MRDPLKCLEGGMAVMWRAETLQYLGRRSPAPHPLWVHRPGLYCKAQ